MKMNILRDPIVEIRTTFKKMIIEIKDITEIVITPKSYQEADLEADLLVNQTYLEKYFMY